MSPLQTSWTKNRLKYLFDYSLSSVDRHIIDGELAVKVCHYPNVYNNEKIVSSADLPNGTCSAEEFERFKLVRGDILITKDSESPDDIGVPCLIEDNLDNTVCGYHLGLLRKKADLEPGYFFRFLQSDHAKGYFYCQSSGITRFGLGKPAVENFSLPIPPLEEQALISRYLDKKTAQIDSLIEKIEKKIELLNEQRTSLINQCVTKGLDPNAEMKDCGVEWIGGIPKHWRLKKITHVTKTIGSGTTPKSDSPEYYDDGTVNWLVTGDLTDGEVHTTSSKITQKAISDYPSLRTYPIDSLLVAMYGATIGKLGILRVASTVNQATCSLCFNASNDTMFWFYVLYANRQYLVSLGYGGGQPNISQDLIKSLRFPAPDSLDEQRDIVQEIGRRLKNHDALVSTEVRRLELLKEYRQSLISSVVTGKIRITEDMV
jgi:type I restriction enzyme S subunit